MSKKKKEKIGTPQDYEHVSHVKWDPEGGFDVDEMNLNIWSQPQVKDWLRDVERMGPFPGQPGRDLPPRPPPSRGALPSPPPPPARGSAAPPPPPAHVSQAAAPPPPSSHSSAPPPPSPQSRAIAIAPPPPSRDRPPPPRPSSRPAAVAPPPPPPMGGGGGGPPPPPPPPPPSADFPSAPSPLPAPVISGGGGRGDLPSQIQGGKKVDPNEEKKAHTSGRGALLDQIQKGVGLKPVVEMDPQVMDFQTFGVSEDQLRDPNTAAFSKDSIDSHSGIDEIKKDVERMGPFPGQPGRENLMSIPWNDLEFGELLGQGGEGIVNQGIWRRSGDQKVHTVAIKHLLKTKECQELKALSKLQHPNIIHIHGYHENHADLYIVMELCPHGSLKAYLRSHDAPLLPTHLLDWVSQSACAVQYLKQCGIVHKDIKTDNFVISSAMILKLADFGIAKDLDNTISSASETGTWRWMAPEIHDERLLSPSSDIFSLALVWWSMVTRQLPYDELKSPFSQAKAICQGKRPVIPLDCMPELAELMKCCWEQDRTRRPNIDDIVATVETIKISPTSKLSRGSIATM